MKSLELGAVSSIVWTWIFLYFETINGVEALRNVTVSIPKAVEIYDDVKLECNYDLEGEPLYSIKWYKGMREFFRFIPYHKPSMVVFPVLGINVDLSRSNEHAIFIQDILPEASGRYTCEVSADAPNFYTSDMSSFMYVVVVPKANPILHIEKEVDHSSYLVRANCTAPPSSPAMNITWFINGLKVNEVGRKVINAQPAVLFPDKHRTQYMAVSYISTEINANAFQGGVITVKCVCSLFHLYRSEQVRYIDDDRPKPWPSSVIGPTTNSGGPNVVLHLPILLLPGLFVFR